MNTSGLLARAAEIFAVNEGRCSRTLNYGFSLGRGFLAGSRVGSSSGGGVFSFRFSFSPKAFCALRLGDGPCAFGFSMSILTEG